MSEQVINIRDRIEKMRTQMTGPNESVARDQLEKKNKVISDSHGKEKKNNENQVASIKKIENSKVDTFNSSKEKIIESKTNELKGEVEKKTESQKFNQYNFESEKTKSKFANKTYKDYHNDNIFDQNKKSVRLEEDQAFPQFNLNVSNPISWKLMLLIMLMQLLTNIMLVVVLYLK